MAVSGERGGRLMLFDGVEKLAREPGDENQDDDADEPDQADRLRLSRRHGRLHPFQDRPRSGGKPLQKLDRGSGEDVPRADEADMNRNPAPERHLGRLNVCIGADPPIFNAIVHTVLPGFRIGQDRRRSLGLFR